MAILCAEVIDRKDTMPKSGKNDERTEQVPRGNGKQTKLEPLRPQSEQPDKLYNDLAKFPEENPYPVLRIHRNGTVLYANKASEGLLKARGSGVGQPAPAQWRQLAKKALSSGQVIREETEHNGRVFAFRAVPIADSDYVNFYGTDITEQKEAVEALRETTQTLEAVIQASPLPIFAVDRELIVKTWNPSAERTFGWSAQEAIGRRYPAIPKEKMDEADALFSHALESGLTEVETLRQRKDGSLMDVSISAAPLRDSRGNINGVMAVLTDITERKRAETELHIALEKYRVLFESFPLGISVTDAAGNLLETNRESERLLGISRDKHTRRKYDGPEWRIVRPDGTPMPPDEYASVRAFKEKRLVENVDMGIVKSGGAITWISVTAAPIPIEGYGVAIAYGDITERKQAEQALKKSNQLLRDTGEMAKVGGWELDLSTREVFCTEETCRIHGLEPGHKLKLEEALNFYAPESRPALEAVLKKAAETGEPYDLESLFIPSGSKDKIWVRSLGRAVYSGGKIVKLAGTFQNIDKYKRAEEQLQEERNLLRTLIDHIPDKVYVKDKDSRFVVCNKALAEFWDKEGKGDIIGKTDFDLFEHTKAQQFFDEEQKVMQTGQPLTNLDRDYPDKAGNVHYVLTTKVPLRDNRGSVTGLLGIHRDITERKQAEQKLLEYQKQLKRLASQLTLAGERERRRIAGELHDQVSQSLALAKIKLDSLHAAVSSQPLAQALEDISGSMEKAIQDTRSLTFDLSSPILHELGFEAAVAEWLNEQVQNKHGIATEFGDDGQSKPLDDDVRVLLFRNVRELLINCIKHAHADKVVVRIRRIDGSIEVTVEDNGVGFDPMEARSMAAKRTEFGLFSVRESLEDMGGRFEIESKPGAGCKATMTAPLKRKGMDDERNKATHQGNGN